MMSTYNEGFKDGQEYQKRQPKEMPKKVKNQIEFLEDRLIPDLKESGQIYTARDLKLCVKYLREAYEK